MERDSWMCRKCGANKTFGRGAYRVERCQARPALGCVKTGPLTQAKVATWDTAWSRVVRLRLRLQVLLGGLIRSEEDLQLG